MTDFAVGGNGEIFRIGDDVTDNSGRTWRVTEIQRRTCGADPWVIGESSVDGGERGDLADAFRKAGTPAICI